MVEGFRGTPFWSALEVGSDCGPTMKYSTILADRWSCRRMILYIAQPHPVNDTSVFASTYSKLLSSDPSSRPPLGKVLDSLRAVGAVKRIGGTDEGFVHVQRVPKWPHINACWYVRFFCHVPSLRLMYRPSEQVILGWRSNNGNPSLIHTCTHAHSPSSSVICSFTITSQ